MAQPVPTKHLRAFSRDSTPYPACTHLTDRTVGTTTTDKAAVNCSVCKRFL